MLTADKQGANMIMTAEEVRTAMEDAFAKVELRDPDHLYVPGRVVHMYDLWNKQDSEKAKNSAKEGADQVAVAEVRITLLQDTVAASKHFFRLKLPNYVQSIIS
jgi:hypothetical protein